MTKLTYQQEQLVSIMHELPELFLEHWLEIAHDRDKIPLDPDWDEYARMELQGKLKIITVRDGPKLVGYYFAFVFNHLHYKTTMFAGSDGFYISKAYRNGLAAGVRLKRLFEAAMKMLRDLGVKKMYLSFKEAQNIEPIIRRLGFKPHDRVFTTLL